MKRRVPLAESRLLRDYEQKTPRSARLAARGGDLFPSGVTHVGRYLRPYAVYAARAAGSRKWDADGNEYVDYFGGHGALMLGHGHPAVVEAASAQLPRGIHYGSSHELEIEWAELIREMIPCAQRVRFTVTGTEATHLALRVSRAYTGRPVVIRLAGHFHGWHDQVAFGAELPPGIGKGVADGILVCPPGDVAHLRQVCEARNDIAALILEATGATFGQSPLPAGFLHELRELTARHKIVLIFDEVISGFRCSSGGAQGYFGITPDLTTLAKVVAGGLPGAALVGRSEILSVLQYRETEQGVAPPLVPHQGTYNAGPVSAAAGIATLKVVRDTDVIERANRHAAAIRDGMNAVIRRMGADWAVYGAFSEFHIFPNPGRDSFSVDQIQAGQVPWQKLKGATPMELIHKVRLGFLCHGVDVVGWPGGLVSGVHTEDDVEVTVNAFAKTLAILAEEGELG